MITPRKFRKSPSIVEMVQISPITERKSPRGLARTRHSFPAGI